MSKKNTSIFERKHVLQILSVLAAITLWFAITHTEDPQISVALTDIELSVLGEGNLAKNDLIFVNADTIPEISVQVRGTRSNVKSILNSVSAKIDLSDITEAGEYSRDLTFDVPNPSVMITKKRYSSVTVKIEKTLSKEIPVYVNQLNAEKNKQYLIKSTPQVEFMTVSGAQEDISRIREIFLSVDVANTTADSSTAYEIAFADAYHNVVLPKNNVFVPTDTVTVDNKIYLRKSAGIALDPNVDTSEYQVIIKSFSTDKIEIGVDLAEENPTDTIYATFVGGIVPNTSGKYPMKLSIPDNIYCPEGDKELIMTADIEKISTVEKTLDITAENIPAGKTADISPNKVSVMLTGSERKMDEIRAKVDLSGLSEGAHNLPVIFVTENTGVTVNETVFVNVNIQ